ncbi:MAG: efflux RND transporter periplasmic adaptor subunit [bacterium]|nr:efflux RND transporter periplasmic adaptor subunit [bacterium]
MKTLKPQIQALINRLGSLLKRRWKRVLIFVVIALPVIALTNFLRSEPEPEYLTAQVERGELVQAVEVVATVISEKDLELKFPVSGIVDELLVSDGDIVIAGQELARLRSGSLNAAVSAAQARLTTTYAELRALEEGARPEDIAIAEAELQNKKASLDFAQSKFDAAVDSLEQANSKLESLQSEAKTASIGEVASASSTLLKEISKTETALGVIEDVFEDLTLQNILSQAQPAEYSEIETQRKATYAAIADFIFQQRGSSKDFREASAALLASRTIINDAARIIQRAYDFISRQEPLGLFDFTKKETLKNSLATQKNNAETAYNNIDTAYKALQDKVANFDTRIATEESNLVTSKGARDQALADINTFRTAVAVSEAQLSLKKAGTRKADVDASRGRVQSARADLERAQADYDDTILRAPIDGTITKVNLKKGEFTPGQFSETVAAITILGVSPYRIEVFTSEIDIPKIDYKQPGELLLDAYPNREFPVEVTEIDPAATIVDGVPKYRIKLDFPESFEKLLKIGMTGDLDIITDIKEDALYIPGRAVIKNEEGEDIVRVLLEDGEVEERPVVVGMETITNVEIVKGLEEGEAVIVLIK